MTFYKGSSGIVYIDPAILRRQTNSAVVMPTNQDSAVSMSTTASQLARAFGIVIRQVADLLMMLQDYHALAPNLARILDITNQEIIDLQMYLECRLKPTWDWLITIMDATEAQLRFGSVLSSVSNSSQSNPLMHVSYVRNSRDLLNREDPRNIDSSRRAKTTPDGNSARRDFLTYALSLMRTHNSEHADSLPTTDVSALKHVAYVLDALIYYMRSGSESEAETLRDTASVQSWQDPEDNLNDDGDDDPVNQSINMETDSMDGESDAGTKSGRRHPFFQRSDSTIFLGCIPPDPFQVPLADALPLAEQPHLLHPYSRKEELFGMPRQTVSGQSLPLDVELGDRHTIHQTWPLNRLPTHMALSYRSSEAPMPIGAPLLYHSSPVMTTSELQLPTYATPAPPAHSLSGHQASAAVDMSNFATGVIVSSPATSMSLGPSASLGLSSSEATSYMDSNLVTYSFPVPAADVVLSSTSYAMASQSSVHLSSIPLPSGSESSAIFEVADLSVDAQSSMSLYRPSEALSTHYPRVPQHAMCSILQEPIPQLQTQPMVSHPQQQQQQQSVGQPSVIVHASSTMNLSFYQAPMAMTSHADGLDHRQDDNLTSSSSEMGLDLSNPMRNLSANKASTSEGPEIIRYFWFLPPYFLAS